MDGILYLTTEKCHGIAVSNCSCNSCEEDSQSRAKTYVHLFTVEMQYNSEKTSFPNKITPHYAALDFRLKGILFSISFEKKLYKVDQSNIFLIFDV